MNKLTSSVVVTFENATPKNFNNALATAINLCLRYFLFRNSYENSILLTSKFFLDVKKNTKIVQFQNFLIDL